MSEEKSKRTGNYTNGYMGGRRTGGVDPSIMGIGPCSSYQQTFKRTGMKVEDLDLIEANEAFAAQSIAVARDLTSTAIS